MAATRVPSPRKAGLIGRGSPPVPVTVSRWRWADAELVLARDDISRTTDWRIRDERHAVIVHLGGRMDELETEIEGRGGSRGAALPGEIWTVPAGQRYASCARGGMIDYAVLYFAPDVADRIAGTRIGPQDIAACAGVRDEFLHHSVRRLVDLAAASDDLSRLAAQSLSQTLCLHVCRMRADGRRPIRVATGPRLSAEQIRGLRDFIDDQLAEAIALADLAQLAGVSTHRLLAAFPRAFGATPAQYIIRQRLRAAQRLLAENRDDITAIALATGFSSHSHLTSTFRRHFGLSPSSYRARGAPAST